jgi:hypothetical protein
MKPEGLDELAEEFIEIKRSIVGRWRIRTLVRRPIPGEFESVLIGVAQVDRIGLSSAIGG